MAQHPVCRHGIVILALLIAASFFLEASAGAFRYPTHANDEGDDSIDASEWRFPDKRLVSTKPSKRQNVDIDNQDAGNSRRLREGYVRLTDVPYHLRLLSLHPSLELAEESDDDDFQERFSFVAHESLGEKVTIVCFDEAFDLRSEDWQEELGVKDWDPRDYSFMLNNDLVHGPFDEDDPDQWLRELATLRHIQASDTAEAIEIKKNHGNMVISLAMGIRFGVAKKATPFLVKLPRRKSDNAADLEAHAEALKNTFGALLASLYAAPDKKQTVFVIPVQWTGFSSDHKKALIQPVFEELYLQCEALNIPIFVAAGNSGVVLSQVEPEDNDGQDWDWATPKWQPLEGQGERLPNLLVDTACPNINIVGGTAPDGTFWVSSSPPGVGTGPDFKPNPGPGVGKGEFSLFAPALVQAPDVEFKLQRVDGTSWAAPIAAGVAAYYLGHPDYAPILRPNERGLPQRLKNFLQTDASVQRFDDPKRQMFNYYMDIGYQEKAPYLFDEADDGYYPLPFPPMPIKVMYLRSTDGLLDDDGSPAEGLTLAQPSFTATSTTISATPTSNDDGTAEPEVTGSGRLAVGGCVEGNPLEGVGIPDVYSASDMADMTVDKCAAFCCGYGYQVVGTLNGAGCWCAARQSLVTDAAKTLDEDQCAVPCVGDPGVSCGGEENLLWFTWTGLLGAQCDLEEDVQLSLISQAARPTAH